MNKSTLILLGALVVLGIVTVLTTSSDEPPKEKTLTIAGYATPAQLDEEKARGLLDGPLDIAHPVDEIVITRKEQTIRLVRDGEGKDSTWTITEPVDAVAVRYLVEKIVTPFKTETSSVFSRSLKEQDLPLYDLEADLRIGLTLKSGGAVYEGVDLLIGKVDKGADSQPGGAPDADTWVALAGDLSTVYRIGGKDLRTPVAEDLSKLRDKKVFSFKPDDVVGVSVTSPSGEALVLAGTRSEEPAAEEGKAPKLTTEWAIEAPAGYQADAAAASLARSLSSLRAQTFVAGGDADLPDSPLGDTPWTITATLHDSKDSYTLRVADTEGDAVWAQVEGKSEWLKLASYSAKNLKKTLADVRDKTVVKIDKGTLSGLVLASDEGPIELVAKAGAWSFVRPRRAFPADPADLLSSLTRLRAVRYATSSELRAARAALAKPAIAGALIAGDTRIDLAMSAKLEGDDPALKGHRWGMVGTDAATAEPFLVSDYVAKRLKTTVDALRDKTVVSGGAGAISRIALHAPGATAPAIFERPAEGGELTLTGVPEGKTAATQPIKTITATLGNLKAKAIRDDVTTKEAGLNEGSATRIVLTMRDGATATLILSEKTADDAVYATIDRGPLKGAVFTVNQYQAKNLKKTPADLLD